MFPRRAILISLKDETFLPDPELRLPSGQLPRVHLTIKTDVQNSTPESSVSRNLVLEDLSSRANFYNKSFVQIWQDTSKPAGQPASQQASQPYLSHRTQQMGCTCIWTRLRRSAPNEMIHAHNTYVALPAATAQTFVSGNSCPSRVSLRDIIGNFEDCTFESHFSLRIASGFGRAKLTHPRSTCIKHREN